MLSVQAKFVAIRRWPTASASFAASGSFSACAWYSSNVLLLLAVVRRRRVRRLGDDEGRAARVVDERPVAGRDAGGIGLRLVGRATGAPASERYSEDGDDCSQHQRAAPASDDDECGHDASPPGEVGLTLSKAGTSRRHRFGAPRNRASWYPGPHAAVRLPAKAAAALRTLAARREANCAARLAKCTVGAVPIAFCTMARRSASALR